MDGSDDIRRKSPRLPAISHTSDLPKRVERNKMKNLWTVGLVASFVLPRHNVLSPILPQSEGCLGVDDLDNTDSSHLGLCKVVAV